MKRRKITKSFIWHEIEENKFSEMEIGLFYACIEATDCIFTASDIVICKSYNDHIQYIDCYVELADTLVYNAEKLNNENEFIINLRNLLNKILVDGSAYMPTFEEELNIQKYLNSYGWFVNEEYTLAVNLDVSLIDSSQLK